MLAPDLRDAVLCRARRVGGNAAHQRSLQHLALGVAGLTAQDATPAPQPAMENFMQRSEKSQATLIENSNEILRRIGGIEKTLGKAGTAAATPDVSALEARLRELETKLATAPAAPVAATRTPMFAMTSLREHSNVLDMFKSCLRNLHSSARHARFAASATNAGATSSSTKRG